MRSHPQPITLIVSALVLAACGTDRDASEQPAHEIIRLDTAGAAAKVVSVNGGGPVIQVLPGPAQFADSAMPIIEKMPPQQRQMMKMMARNGPFSDKVAQVSGAFTATFWDKGASGDSAAGVAEFRSQDGASWRVVLKRVAAQDLSPMEPTFGGVATDLGYHGATGLHAPLVPTVRSAVSYWGMAEVYRNGQLVTDQAPVHVMMTSDTRGDDFAYKCWDCTRNPIEQLHLMLPPPEGKPYQVPGGVLHVMWEKSQYQRT
jgi:hypothetical protein